MSRSVKIVLPVFPSHLNVIHFQGFMTDSDQQTVVWITKYSQNVDYLPEKKYREAKTIYGYCGDCTHMVKNIKTNKIYPNFLILDKQTVPQLNKLFIDGKQFDGKDNCIIILYDHDKIKNSESISDTDDYFTKLQKIINCEDKQSHYKYEPFVKSPYWLASSMFIQHLLNYMNLIHWLISIVKKDKKIPIKQGNLIMAILIDILLGYILLQMFTQDKKVLSSMLMGVLEKLVNSLYSLLKWLMGAPAGLKLNNAFNKMLGKYFSYHIQLWWLFIEVSGEKLDVILHVYHYIGYLGFTFQAAIISDMLCIATFHSYCIYVYAARLFNIQISGLIALLRLFVGRKHNPLRGGIDSCEYTNQELFVGTVAFTILLLLLPTTAMYYIVFTLFRLLSLMVQYALAKLIYLVQTLPLYVVILWLVQSPKVAGNILLEVVSSEEVTPLILKVKLFSKSLHELINKFKPPVLVPKQIEWTNLLSNVFVGKQII